MAKRKVTPSKANKAVKAVVKVEKTKGNIQAKTKEGAPKSELTAQQADMLRAVRGKATGVRPGQVGVGQAGVGQAARQVTKEAQPRRAGGLAPHGIVRARAGTGKTFTLVLGAAWAYRGKVWGNVCRHLGFEPQPSPQQQVVWDFISQEKPREVTYCAFNNSIVDEFSGKYRWLVDSLGRIGVQLSFSTVHKMGNAVCGRHYRLGWRAVNKYRTRNMLEVLWGIDLREVWKQKAIVIQAIEELVHYSKINLAGWGNGLGTAVAGAADGVEPSREAMEALAMYYGVDLGDEGQRDEIFQTVPQLWRQSYEQVAKEIDFDDMLWLPVVNKLTIPRHQLLLVDEGQDLNRCQQEFILRAGERILLVGDECQAIYGFAGSDVDSINNMERMLGGAVGAGSNGEDGVSRVGVVGSKGGGGVAGGGVAGGGRGVQQMTLTVTRRCGKAIVARAKEIVPDFEAHPSNGAGMVNRLPWDQLDNKDNPRAPQEGDMLLCRVNAPLVGLAFRYIRQGRRANIQGRNIGDGLKTIIRNSKQSNVSDFLVWLDEYHRREQERLAKRKQKDEEAAITLQDRVECLRVFCDGAVEIGDLYANIDKVFGIEKQQWHGRKGNYANIESKNEGEEPKGRILLSSIHRAKGLEAGRVFVLRPDLLPHPMAKTDWARGQERHLEYVAITRAIDELVWVDGPAAL